MTILERCERMIRLCEESKKISEKILTTIKKKEDEIKIMQINQDSNTLPISEYHTSGRGGDE